MATKPSSLGRTHCDTLLPLQVVGLGVPATAFDLLGAMVIYVPAARITAANALEHAYFCPSPHLSHIVARASPVELPATSMCPATVEIGKQG